MDTTGPVSSSIIAKLKAFKNGIKFYYTKQGHVVVPGLAGDGIENGYLATSLTDFGQMHTLIYSRKGS